MNQPGESVLVVDDERDLAESCAFFLERAGHDATVAFSGEEAIERMGQTHFDVVVTDIKMPRMSGIALLDAIKSRDPDIEVILVTGYPEVEMAVHSIKSGAFDYVTKPFEETELLERVEKALAHRRLKEHNVRFKERLRRGSGGRQLIGDSPRFEQIVATLERAARTDASVLILGESGTGKEVLAHHLHDCSDRSDKPFVPVDCATMPESLVESELFGHVKGAFSGATGQKMGLFQVADGGTLFLDEIGELPLSFQTKLLRAIQERQIRRVGGTDTVDVDVRIVCATNRNLQKEVEEGRFRQDLFYRLDVIRVEVPPLRERPDDIEALAMQFLIRFSDQNGMKFEGFDPEALVAMKAFAWPGNVRQLRNAVDRACALGIEPLVRVEDLPEEVRQGEIVNEVVGAIGERAESFQEMKARTLAALESTYVVDLLKRHDGNVTRSAEESGMARSAFQKLMQRYGIKSSDFRGS